MIGVQRSELRVRRRRCIRGTSVTATLRLCRRPYRRAKATLRAGRTAQQPAMAETPALLICLFQCRPVTVPEAAVGDGPGRHVASEWVSRFGFVQTPRIHRRQPSLQNRAHTHCVAMAARAVGKAESFLHGRRLVSRTSAARSRSQPGSCRQRVTAGTRARHAGHAHSIKPTR